MSFKADLEYRYILGVNDGCGDLDIQVGFSSGTQLVKGAVGAVWRVRSAIDWFEDGRSSRGYICEVFVEFI